MADPKDSPISTGVTTLLQGESEEFTRHGPLITVDELYDEFLFGVPLTAPLTGQTVQPETLKKFIRKAVGDFETSVRIPITPVRMTEQFDYKRADDAQFGTRRLSRWPLLKVEKIEALWPGRNHGQEVAYPTSWVEPDGDTGLIRLVPRSGTDIQQDIAFTASHGYSGITFSNLISWPHMWSITYIAGFDSDKIPDIVNDLIGTIAAYKFLSQMGPALFPMNSTSIGIDGLSQGTGNAGPRWLEGRLSELKEEQTRLTAQLKAHYGTDIVLFAF